VGGLCFCRYQVPRLWTRPLRHEEIRFRFGNHFAFANACQCLFDLDFEYAHGRLEVFAVAVAPYCPLTSLFQFRIKEVLPIKKKIFWSDLGVARKIFQNLAVMEVPDTDELIAAAMDDAGIEDEDVAEPPSEQAGTESA
jgi:hypothetical protein